MFLPDGVGVTSGSSAPTPVEVYAVYEGVDTGIEHGRHVDKVVHQSGHLQYVSKGRVKKKSKKGMWRGGKLTLLRNFLHLFSYFEPLPK